MATSGALIVNNFPPRISRAAKIGLFKRNFNTDQRISTMKLKRNAT